MADEAGQNAGDQTQEGVAAEDFVDLGLLELTGAEPRVGRKRHVDDTRAVLAYALVGLIALVILGLFVLLKCGKIDADDFGELAGQLLAPLVGLLGAATGYYYGRNR